MAQTDLAREIREADTTIRQLEAKMKQIRERLQDLCEAFIVAAVEWAPSWSKAQVEMAIEANPTLVKKLGVERLRELKAALQKIMASAGAVRGQVDSDGVWPHRQELPSPPASITRHSYPTGNPKDSLDSAILRTTGQLGALLRAHHFESDRWDFTGDPPRYTVDLVWSERMDELYKKYRELYGKEFAPVASALGKERDRKEQLEAKSLWEQA